MSYETDDYKIISISGFICKANYVLIPLSIMIWLACLLMPYRYNFDCLGEIIEHQEGNYIFKDEETQTVQAFYHRVVYKTPDGKTGVTYYGEHPRIFREVSTEYTEENEWQYAYKYRLWTNNFIYLLATLIFIAFSMVADEDTWTFKIRRRKRPTLKHESSTDSSLW